MFFIISLVFTTVPVHSEHDNNKIFLKLNERQLCSGRLNKCFPMAIGSSTYPSPNIPGPHLILDIRRNGFNWIHPTNNKLYKAGTHNLGNYWVTIYHDSSNGWTYGVHTTPQPNTNITTQSSMGCFRLRVKDMEEFINSVRMFDVAYIIN